MTRRSLARLSQMGWTEVGWRARAHARIAIDRLRSALVEPRWDRAALLPALAPLPALNGVRTALGARHWDAAHRELTRHFTSAPGRFVISASNRPSIVHKIASAFPEGRVAAAARADRVVGGEYDLLGYRGLRFNRAGDPMPDWHFDPVHDRHAPRAFWSTVPYLDPACGDHKVIWELNRHQHWLVLGRAFWLTGDSGYRDRALSELESWLAANPPLRGTNWASMLELALRSLSWIWALHLFADSSRDDEVPWLVDLLLALDRQLSQVERNLSYYFSPNTHLLGEALALYVAGRTLPELDASGRRESVGRETLLREIHRQIGRDGGHCERSTHYHRYTLDFYVLALAVARITGDPVADRFEGAVVRLATAARALADDAGLLPLLGDDDGGALWPFADRPPYEIADSLAIAAALVDRPDLAVGAATEGALWLLAHPALAPSLRTMPSSRVSRHIASTALPDMGYYVSRSAAGGHLVIDGGPHGYKNGGHAHADALALTLSVRGIPMLIDPGTGGYTVDSTLRDRMRSTALHNTLTLDGRSQSVPNGPFHWLRTADARVIRWRTDEAFDYFVGAHDGYAPGEHRRHVLMRHGDLMIVADFVNAIGSHTATVHWHIDPRWTVRTNEHRVDLASAGHLCQLVVPDGRVEQFVGDPEAGLGWHAPIYGRVEPATTVRVTSRGTGPFWIAAAFGLDPNNAISAAEFLAVETATGGPTQAVGIRVFREQSIDDVLLSESPRGFPGATVRFGAIDTDAYLYFCRTMRGQQTPRVLADLRLDQPCAA